MCLVFINLSTASRLYVFSKNEIKAASEADNRGKKHIKDQNANIKIVESAGGGEAIKDDKNHDGWSGKNGCLSLFK